MRWIEQIYIQVIFRFFWQHELLFFCLVHRTHSCTVHTYLEIYIYNICVYIYRHPLCIWIHWQGTKYVCNMYLFAQFSYNIFLFLFAHSIRSVKHQIILYISVTYIPCFIFREKSSLKGRTIYYVFLFYVGLSPINRNIYLATVVVFRIGGRL